MSDFTKELADAMNRQAAAIEKLAGQKEMKKKDIALFGTFTEMHGNGSLYGNVPVERDVVSAHIAPQGISSFLPWVPTVYDQPFFASLTGFTALSGNQPVYPCSNAQAGYEKNCLLTAQFGRLMIDTQTIEIDKTLRKTNRGDFTDLMLHGNLLGDLKGFTPGGLSQDDILNIVTKNEMVIAAVNMQRQANTMTWQGNPALRTAGGGWVPFPGLDRQIATGQVDALTNVACPALESDVKDFAWDNVEGNGRDIVEYMQMLEYYIVVGNAMRMGMMPAKWVWVMRPEAWQVISNIWPCRYNTNRCATILSANASQANSQLVLMGTETVAERDAMRAGMYIDVNGRRYDVIVDDGIFEWNVTNAGQCLAGEYASSIYFVPVTVDGGLPATFFEYMDYRQVDKETAYTNGRQNFWTDDGKFLWAYEDVGGYCYKLKLKIEPRIVLRTPQLAGRIDRVKYVPLQHLRSSDPSNTYFRDGGVSLRGNRTVYSVW